MSIWREGKTWRYEFQVYQKRYTRGGFLTKGEALAAREVHKKEIRVGKQTLTVTDFRTAANEYLDLVQRKSSTKTYKEKVFVYNQFKETVGNLPLDEITGKILTSYLLTRPTDANYNKHRKNLCAFFKWAADNELISKSPCLKVPILPHEPGTKAIPNEEDMLKLFLAAGDLRVFFLALYSLAGRINEINRLRWDDVNFERRQVNLWTRKGDGTYRKQVKSLNDELWAELKRLYGRGSGEWVFPNPETGKPYVDRRKQLKRICAAAGIPYLGFHAIRHHVASLLADTHKVSLPTIQKMLGHSRLTTTERYVQSLGQGVREAAELLKMFTDKNKPHAEPHEENKKEPGD